MAERPVFVPRFDSGRLVEEKIFSFNWNPGLAAVQKKRNVEALHAAAERMGVYPILEVSSKSEEEIGRRLSAFNLKVEVGGRVVPMECVFQGSKVFDNGGPFEDIFEMHPREAKRDLRLIESGSLVGFLFEGRQFPLIPKTLFYDWLYIKSLYPHRDWLRRLGRYAGFSDIEFNPSRSINCQARSCATFVSLEQRGVLDECLDSVDFFMKILMPDSLEQPHSDDLRQQNLI